MYHTGAFDQTVDVIVLGLGDAGATAALTASSVGADVLIVDKQELAAGRSNSRYAAGYFLVPDDLSAAERHLMTLYEINDEHRDLDPAMVRTLLAESALTPTWWADLGGASRRVGHGGEHRGVEGSDSLAVHRGVPTVSNEPGCPIHTHLVQLVHDAAIPILAPARATWLLTDATGAVTGVEVHHDGRVRHIRARRGVVMALGGFEADESMKRSYLPSWPTRFYGSRANTGDGVRMATDVGARLWHMNAHPGALVAHVPETGYPAGLAVDLLPAGAAPPPGTIVVDQFAQRYTREDNRQHAMHLEVTAYDAVSLTRPRTPAWWIFDERRRQHGPVLRTTMGPAGPLRDVTWSPDNSAEIARGWIHSGASLADLARSCGLDADALSATAGQYNRACAAGVDRDHGRASSTMTPLDEGPFYALALWPGGSHTLGGAQRDPQARVMSVRGGTIRGLYSAGEFGSMYGLLYPGGGASLSECLAFGRIAGREVAAATMGAR